jgi:hypothetical protein
MEALSAISQQGRRQALVADVQRIMASELPALAFGCPRLWFAMGKRIVHATPAAFRPPILWNPTAIAVMPTR